MGRARLAELDPVAHGSLRSAGANTLVAVSQSPLSSRTLSTTGSVLAVRQPGYWRVLAAHVASTLQQRRWARMDVPGEVVLSESVNESGKAGSRVLCMLF